MHAELARAPLLAALTRAAKVVERKNTIPVLSNVLFHAGAGGVRLQSTDLDVELFTPVEMAKVECEGSIALPAHLLLKIVDKMPEGTTISIDQAPGAHQALIRGGSATFKIHTMPIADFPTMQSASEDFRFRIDGDALADAIGRVEFAMSKEETRYYLNGIYLHLADGDEGEVLRLVATDGHRLSMADMPLPDDCEGMPGIIVPRKAIDEIRHMAGTAGGEITLSGDSSLLVVELGMVRFTTKLIDGTFPDYKRVIPTGRAIRATVEASSLKAAVERVSVIASEKGRAVKFEFADDKLLLAVANPDAGEASDEVEAPLDGEPITIGFNASYVLNMLGAALPATGPVEFEMRDAKLPAIVRRPGNADALCILMPMQV